jgi:dUTP pyrophosphatase
VDEDYRGNLCVVLCNHYGKPFHFFFCGDRIAQLICQQIYYPGLEDGKELRVDDTERGKDGFGSTGGN